MINPTDILRPRKTMLDYDQLQAAFEEKKQQRALQNQMAQTGLALQAGQFQRQQENDVFNRQRIGEQDALARQQQAFDNDLAMQKLAVMQAGGGNNSQPSAVKEYEYYAGLEPQAQQTYLSVKRADPYTQAFSRELGKSDAKAQVNLPDIEQDAMQTLELIDRIASHNGLKDMVGVKNIFGGAIPGTDWTLPGSRAANFKALFDQLNGQMFMRAYKTLKGGGQITEIEGKKATDALAALALSQSVEQFMENLNILRDIVSKGLERARAGIIVAKPDPSYAPASVPQDLQNGYMRNGYMYIGGDPTQQSSWRHAEE